MIKIEGFTKAEQAESVLRQLNTQATNFPGMTYEEGIEIALRWMLNEISDWEFEENI